MQVVSQRLVQLRLDCFEGPLELLLLLIEQQRLPITQVSLAEVADQYLAQVHALPYLDADLLAEFVAIGGRLLLLKSRALLLAEESDAVADEVVSDLAERLATYRVFRAAADSLQALEQRGARGYGTTREVAASAALAPLAPITPQALLAALRRVDTRRQPEAAPPRLVPRASVDERRGLILAALRGQPTVVFTDVAGATVDQVVASFLAVLELSRRGVVRLEQASVFAPLLISGRGA